MSGRVAVIGTGSWGTAAAGLVAGHADEVCMLARSDEVARSISELHRNPRHLSSYELPANVRATTNAAEALAGAGQALVAVPSSFLRATLASCAAAVPDPAGLLVLTKGIETGSHLLMTEVVAQELGHPRRIAALSGPNHAEEISRGMVSAGVVAAEDEALARDFQRLLHSTSFRAYRSRDVRGVEVCAAVKNVIAIACGVCAGLGMGDNALAVLMTRGLAEVGRIVSALGGDTLTCMGLAGMGDLVATCTSRHSRNRSFGEAFAAGETLESYEGRTRMVVEGARAAVSVWELACEMGIETPVTHAVHAILYEGVRLEEAAGLLLDRGPNEEFYGLRTNE